MNRHANAVETAIAAAGAKLGPADQPLVELVRVLAEQMDVAGSAPSVKLSASYLSALKDVRRVLGDAPAVTPVNNKLAQLRANHARFRSTQ